MKTKKSKFEKEYFGGYYFKNVGHFTKRDLNRSINWFAGWFSYLQKFVDFKDGKKRKVLEIGCSIGGASSILADRDFKVFASDVSKLAIQNASRLAKENGRRVSFYKFDVQDRIPINHKFDIIYAFEVIEHLKNPFKAIENMRLKLKEKGILICSTPNKDYDMSSDPTHTSIKSELEWEKIFKRAGFNIVNTSQVSFLPFFYNFSRYFHLVLPFRIRSRYINSPLFIIARK